MALIVAGCGVTLLPEMGVPLALPEGVVLVPMRGSSARRYSLLAMR